MRESSNMPIVASQEKDDCLVFWARNIKRSDRICKIFVRGRLDMIFI